MAAKKGESGSSRKNASPTSDDTGRRALRNALGQFATGVTVVTARDAQGRPLGITVNSFNSVSLDPPLVLWSIAETSYGYEHWQKVVRFCVNVLASDQQELAWRFSRVSHNKFEGVALRAGLGDVPMIEGCLAYFECEQVAHHPGGDHVIVIGRVERFLNTDRTPLIFHSGRFFDLSDRPKTAEGGDKHGSAKLWLTGK